MSSDDELPAPPKRLCNESPVMMAEGPSTVMTNQGPSTSPDLVMTGQGPSTSSQDLVASERQVKGCFTHFYEFGLPKYNRGTLKKQGRLYRNKTKHIMSH